MFTGAGRATLCAWLFLHGARAAAQEGTVPPAPTAEPAPPAAPVAAAPAPSAEALAADARVKAAAEEPEATASLERLTRLYEHAQRLLGGEHVMLTATLYVGKQHHDDARLQGGAAGLVSLPLFGAGGGHGGDWYPVLQTEESADALERFQREVERYSGLVELIDDPRRREEALRALLEATKLLAREVEDADPALWEAARALKKCVSDLDDVIRAANPVAKAAMVPKTDSKAPALEEWVADVGEVPEAAAAVVNSCRTLFDESRGVPDALANLRALLESYWKALGEEKVPRRHAFLIGPTLGIPVTTDPTDVVLAGGLVEVGGGHYFRVAASAGIQIHYDDVLARPGWFAGLALSGELGDDLFHLFNGGLAAARNVIAQPVP